MLRQITLYWHYVTRDWAEFQPKKIRKSTSHTKPVIFSELSKSDKLKATQIIECLSAPMQRRELCGAQTRSYCCCTCPKHQQIASTIVWEKSVTVKKCNGQKVYWEGHADQRTYRLICSKHWMSRQITIYWHCVTGDWAEFQQKQIIQSTSHTKPESGKLSGNQWMFECSNATQGTLWGTNSVGLLLCTPC